ncbi:MAG: efflux RND transporter periplasmic adaptor subunit [Candidatus Omnitrophica bacterium]|nr:efflux RND transporter periplasmic adaptor subunit [Candidatus Omnitrophota bacterium]
MTMKPKLTYLLIALLITFWIVFIGWGMVRTAIKLTQERKTSFIEVKPKPAETKKEEKVSTPKPQQTKETTKELPSELSRAETEPKLTLVRTYKVKPIDFQDVLPVMGTVKGKTEIKLKFEITGTIKTIYFREGQKIKKGDLIAELDPKDAQLKLDYARSKLEAAEAAYRSLEKKLEVHQKLYEAGAIIKSKLEEVELEIKSAESQVETARSEMKLAENELKKTSIYAYKDGVMGPRKAEEAEFVTPQDEIGSLFEIDEVYVDVGVVERDINKIKLGQKAKIFVDAYPNTTFEGFIDKIYPVIEGKSRTLTAKIKVPNTRGLLLPGMFSRAEILIIELKSAFMVPAVALIQSAPGVNLMPVIPKESLRKTEDETQTGTVELRQVDLGYLTSDYAQILKGVSSDDLVVTETQGELKDRIRVKIVAIEEPSF